MHGWMVGECVDKVNGRKIKRMSAGYDNRIIGLLPGCRVGVGWSRDLTLLGGGVAGQ